MRQFASYMRKKRLKSTEQRDVIARVFFETRGHMNIEELLAKSRLELPSIGYATVYRTLRLLTECGLAAMRRFGEGGTVFEAAGDTAHHDHLICIECGHVLEFENDEIEKLQEQVARSFGFNLVRHKLELYGMCPKARGIRGGSCPHDDDLAAKRANGESVAAPRPISRGEPLRGNRVGWTHATPPTNPTASPRPPSAAAARVADASLEPAADGAAHPDHPAPFARSIVRGAGD
jgi:Fur family ferric uptake transcriptional regulator